jgi:TonB-dependent receptor
MNTQFQSWTRSQKAALLGTSMLAGISSILMLSAPAAAQGQVVGGVETVTATGYARSLELSTEAKRQSLGFSDTIFAEDIGKFPDTNVAESLNRIPGITIQREVDGSGTNVSIRGLGTNFTKVLLNGAQVVTSSTGPTNSTNSNREVDLNIFPTELFTQLTVDKAARADELEGGAAGVVNLRSARPFDTEGFRFTYNVGTINLSNQDAYSPRGSVIVSDTWGPFGALIGLSGQSARLYTTGYESVGYTNPGLSYQQCGVAPPAGTGVNTTAPTSTGCNLNGGGNWSIPGAVPNNVTTNGLVPGTLTTPAYLQQLNPGLSLSQIDNMLVPRLGRPFMEKGARSRYSGVVSLEYRPSDDLHFYMDFVGGRITNAFDRADINWIGRNGSSIPTNVKVDASNVVTSGTFANAAWFLEARPYHERNDYLSINPGMEWDIADKLHASLQANASRSHFFRDSPTVLVQTNTSAGNPAGVPGPTPPVGGIFVTYANQPGAPFPSITTNLNLNDPNNYQWNGGRVNVQSEKRYTYTNGIHGDLRWGGDEIDIKGGFAFDAAHRFLQGYDNTQPYQNAICGDGPSVFLFSPNTQPQCQGLNVAGTPAQVNAAAPGQNYPSYPALGTGFSTGLPTPLTYRGSSAPTASLAQYLRPGPAGFINVDYNKLFKDTNYASFAYPNAPVSNGTNGGTNSGIIDEKNYGLYLESNGNIPIAGRTLHYNVGVRWVTTLQNITGPVSLADPRNTTDPDGAGPLPAACPGGGANLRDGSCYPNIQLNPTARHMYQAFLPAINVVYDVADDFKVRGSISRSMTRPDPNAMLPGVNFGDPSAANATLGNQSLKPFFSNNIDLGAELYTGGAGVIAVNAFRKGLSGFTGPSVATQPFSFLSQYGITYDTLGPTQQTALNSRGGPSVAQVNVTSTVNAAGLLTINGLEVNWVQPLDFLLEDWGLPGFGTTANMTIVDQKGSGAAPAIAQGVSPFTYNVTGYYDHDGISLRLSYVWNDTQVVSGTNQNGLCLPSAAVSTCPDGARIYKRAYGQLDFSSSLRLAKIFGDIPSDPELTFDVQNVTKSKLSTYWQYPNVTGDYYRQGTTYLIGLRGSF